MTIGVGFQCQNGVVLGADTQFTSPSGFKYSGQKIWSAELGECRFIYTFCGSPDTAEIMFRKLREGLEKVKEIPAGQFSKNVLRSKIEEIFYDERAQEQGFQTLIGASFGHHQPSLYRTNETKVVDGFVEHIGLGDSSVLRYLTDFLPPEACTIAEVYVLASYYVSVANRYVDGCSGGPAISVLDMTGIEHSGRGGPLPDQQQRFWQCEKRAAKELREQLISGRTGAD